MKKLIVFIAALLPLSAVAEKKAPHCPIIVDLSTGEYVSSKGKFKCFANAKAAEKKGYTKAVGAVPTPAPISFSGNTNTNTAAFTISSTPKNVTYSHAGTGNFIVRLINADTNEYEELLVNTLGAVNSSTLIYVKGRFYLDITANGAWAVNIN